MDERQANLQRLRKEILKEREALKALLPEEPSSDTLSASPSTESVTPTTASVPQPLNPLPRRVRHPKYGIGNLVSENDLTLEAEFPGYGKKEFLKAFGELELLDED